MLSTGALLVGPGNLLEPHRVRRVYVSPRLRAMRTFELLFAPPPGERESGEKKKAGVCEGVFGGGAGSIVVTEEVREWDYGEYEGMKAGEVRELRKRRGLDSQGREWSVWRDRCEGGEFVVSSALFFWREGGFEG